MFNSCNKKKLELLFPYVSNKRIHKSISSVICINKKKVKRKLKIIKKVHVHLIFFINNKLK